MWRTRSALACLAAAKVARLLGARSDAELHIRRVSEARVAESTMTERVEFLKSEGRRLEDGAADLDARLAARRDEIERTDSRRTQLRESITSTERSLDESVRLLEGLRAEMLGFDDAVSGRG